MIYTLTTNPAIDLNITTDSIKSKTVNRTLDTVYSPNGKGLNVSFVLKYFGIDSKVLGFFGGFTGKYIVEETIQKGVEVLPVWVNDKTRINIFLNDGTDEYKFVNRGSNVDKGQQNQMLEMIENLEDMAYLSISGSLPPGIESSFYYTLLERCQKRNVQIILDISTPQLKNLLAFKPLLIKPNDEEIESIFNIKIQDELDVIDTLSYLYENGAQNILLTMGDKGSYFYNGNAIYYCPAQTIQLLSSACAGDSALAGFLSIWLQEPDRIADAMVRSAAVGANVAESNGLGDFKNVEKYINNLKVRLVK